MTAAALPLPLEPFDDPEPPCPDCVICQGLCGDDRCRRQVLPQLAKPALVRLIGDTLVEQTKRQRKVTKVAPVSPQQRAWKARKAATQTARSKRRGYFGLAKAIMERKA